jgi:outer membrane immunogenic protein
MRTSLTKICLSLAGIFVASSLFAGPMPMDKSVVPVQPACDWTGFYIGINAGVGQLDSTINDRNAWSYGDEGWTSHQWTETAFVGGGQIGYNYQWQDLVFGIEADASGSTADIKRDSFYGSLEYPNEGYRDGHTDQATIDFMGTIRGRLGISLNNNRALLYATAGGAYAHGKWDHHTYYEFGYTPVDLFDGDWRGDDWRWGWVGGFGFEYALNCHWSLRGEGLYYWFGEDTTGIDGPSGAFYADPSNGYTYKYTFSDSFWTYRVGLNYKFTGFFGAH